MLWYLSHIPTVTLAFDMHYLFTLFVVLHHTKCCIMISDFYSPVLALDRINLSFCSFVRFRCLNVCFLMAVCAHSDHGFVSFWAYPILSSVEILFAWSPCWAFSLLLSIMQDWESLALASL